MARKSPSLSASLKIEVETKAEALIEGVLKPKYVKAPPKNATHNYITDIGVKWYRSAFYFFSTYACPGPNVISPSFESKFARMEYLGMGRFALSFMRHTEQWMRIYEMLTVDECLKSIQDDPWFVP